MTWLALFMGIWALGTLYLHICDVLVRPVWVALVNAAAWLLIIWALKELFA